MLIIHVFVSMGFLSFLTFFHSISLFFFFSFILSYIFQIMSPAYIIFFTKRNIHLKTC